MVGSCVNGRNETVDLDRYIDAHADPFIFRPGTAYAEIRDGARNGALSHEPPFPSTRGKSTANIPICWYVLGAAGKEPEKVHCNNPYMRSGKPGQMITGRSIRSPLHVIAQGIVAVDSSGTKHTGKERRSWEQPTKQDGEEARTPPGSLSCSFVPNPHARIVWSSVSFKISS
jgi:hypothetical protein